MVQEFILSYENDANEGSFSRFPTADKEQNAGRSKEHKNGEEKKWILRKNHLTKCQPFFIIAIVKCAGLK